jgi:transcriptional regulator with XRE-family HTH domain
MKNKEDLARRIGNRLRELRKDRGMNQKNLAETTHFSTPLISRMENGLTMPSIATLQVMADAMEVSIGYFFMDEEQKRYVISRRGNRRIVVSKKGYVVELLAEGMENQFMEPAITTLTGTGMQTAVHAGQEFLYVLEGKIKLSLGRKTFTLNKDDVAYFDGELPHKGVNLGKKAARTLNVHLVPGRRSGTFETAE